ncbi:MAG TPA: helix-turn-helix transcriptional regulator, partial [Streptosporangiaceae bacterium]
MRDVRPDMGDDDEHFGLRLRTRRQSARMSQQELARRSGLSIRTISDLERGRTRWPYRDSLSRLADALELTGPARSDFIALAGRRVAQTAGNDPSGDRGPVMSPDARPPSGRVVPRQLPIAVPGFTGRRDQLAALSELLGDP